MAALLAGISVAGKAGRAPHAAQVPTLAQCSPFGTVSASLSLSQLPLLQKMRDAAEANGKGPPNVRSFSHA